MCAPPESARRSFIGSMPPTQVTTRAPALAYSHWSSLLTWMASSRVGVMTSASGALATGAVSPSRSADAIASPKATVLPDPVFAETIRSRPCASSAMTADWTGVSCVYSRASSACARAGWRCGWGMAAPYATGAEADTPALAESHANVRSRTQKKCAGLSRARRIFVTRSDRPSSGGSRTGNNRCHTACNRCCSRCCRHCSAGRD